MLLFWLGDVIPVGLLGSVVSVGNLILLTGLVLLIGLGMARQRKPDARAADVLERAADLIERHGWCRGEFRDGQGRVCLEFALMSADLEGSADARRSLTRELERRGLRSCPLVDWNDLYAANEVEVVSLLRDAAARTRAVDLGRPAGVVDGPAGRANPRCAQPGVPASPA